MRKLLIFFISCLIMSVSFSQVVSTNTLKLGKRQEIKGYLLNDRKRVAYYGS